MASIVWFREDLRLTNNNALAAALAAGGSVVPVFVHDDRPSGGLRRGAAARWWLHGTLESLDRSLRSLGSRLLIASGPTPVALAHVATEVGASTIFACPSARNAGPDDVALKRLLRAAGLDLVLTGDAYLVDPEVLLQGRITPYRVFASFERAARAAIAEHVPLAAPTHLPAPDVWPSSHDLDALRLRDRRDFGRWSPGEPEARRRLAQVVERTVENYGGERDIPSIDGTSILSPHLSFGEIAASEAYALITRREAAASGEPAHALSRQLLWREHARHLLAALPSMIDTSVDPRFDRMPWRDAPDDLERWQRGQTGYPLVDAGMRQLAATGWMHNRVRMVTASFLVKHLLIPWQHGADWFWESLVDADVASNAMNWQWVAGTGVDAAPYFRVFNPLRQAERFDPEGAYVRRWVPELASLPSPWIHRPAAAPTTVLETAGVHPGTDYPLPMVEHEMARARYLEAARGVRD